MLPCPRQLQRIKQVNKVRDGRDIKVYQNRVATKACACGKRAGKRNDYGYLMVEKMKLKHGVLWNSQTGEVVGLADDMLDMNSKLRRIFSDEGDVAKPAVYVNQWRFIVIRAGETEGWMCGFSSTTGHLPATLCYANSITSHSHVNRLAPTSTAW